MTSSIKHDTIVMMDRQPGEPTNPMPSVVNAPSDPAIKAKALEAEHGSGKRHVVVITDMSGSMSTLAREVRTAFNTHVKDMKDEVAKAAEAGQILDFRYTVTVFDTEFIPLCVDAPLDQVPEFTEDNYMPRGFTALLDAVGKTVAEFERRVTLGPTDRVLVIIQTDGQENSSKEYGWDAVKKMLSERASRPNWQILYLGEGADAWISDGSLGAGVSVLRSASSASSTKSRYASMTKGTLAYAAAVDPADVAVVDFFEQVDPGAGASSADQSNG